MALGEDNKILEQISRLEAEHQELQNKIDDNQGDQIFVRRLKKEKLALKDEISRLHSYIEPDIIA